MPWERKHPNGTRSNRKTKNGGTWKKSHKGKPQYDHMNQVVGWKACLFYLDEKGNKTDWLMHEYTTDNPNIPIGSQEQKEDSNKVIYYFLKAYLITKFSHKLPFICYVYVHVICKRLLLSIHAVDSVGAMQDLQDGEKNC